MNSIEEAEQFVNRLLSTTTAQISEGCIDLTTLNPRNKWLNLLFNDTPSDSIIFTNRVGDYFNCRRGIATGANDYFCLTPSEIREHNLTKAHVEPCITKAVDADGLIFTRQKFDKLVADKRRCFLLNPSRNGQNLTRYLKLGEQQGVPKRHLPSHRPIWYLPENRAVADIWVAVFSRESAKFILNTSGAKNLTCFHGLYAKSDYKFLPPLMTLFLNSSAGRQAFSKVNRFYGDGLNKLEPKDVEEMPCPVMPNLSHEEARHLIQKLADMETLLSAEQKMSIDKLAETYFNIKAVKSFSSPPHRVQNHHLVEQRKRHAVQAS